MSSEDLVDEGLLTSDVAGLTKAAPSSRRGFMTASVAVTAGYPLAAGPVRADAITTDANGLAAGDVKIELADGEMPGYFARPNGVANPPVVAVAPVLGLYAEADTGIPVAAVEALEAALAADKTAEFKLYPGAPHGFHADYRKEAAEDAWSRMQAWFKKYKVPG
jgi:alpha-beta hydrolase superfamily lysophospholipase